MGKLDATMVANGPEDVACLRLGRPLGLARGRG